MNQTMSALEYFNEFYSTAVSAIEGTPTPQQLQVIVLEGLLRTFDLTGEDEYVYARDVFQLLRDIQNQ